MRTYFKHILLIITLLATSTFIKSEDSGDEDFDLDLIDINTPKKQNKLLDNYFPQEDSFVDASQMLDLMYIFLLDNSMDNIQIVQSKHDNGKQLKHSEEDLLSAAHTIQMMMKEAQDKLENDVFHRQDAQKLLNREYYNEYVQKLADKLLENMDTKALEEEFEPESDL